MAFDQYRERLVRTKILAVDEHEGDFDLIVLQTPARQTLRVTPGHWLLTASGWQLSDDLRAGARLRTATGGYVEVRTIWNQRNFTTAVYNLRTHQGSYLVGTPGAIASGRRRTEIPDVSEELDQGTSSQLV